MRPPALARALVRLATEASERDALLADLAERFDDVARAAGPGAAQRWYWLQALSALRWAVLPDLDLLQARSWSGLSGDTRQALRLLARRPLFATGAVGTLALGLGAATLLTSVAWTVWLAPLPYPDPDRLVRLYEVAPGAPGGDPNEAIPSGTRGTARVGRAEGGAAGARHLLSPTMLEALRRHPWRTLAGVTAMLRDGGGPDWIREGEIRPLRDVVISPGGLELLGVVPTLGRAPALTERETLLSERFWRTQLGADPDVVGSSLTMSFGAVPIVGVAPLARAYPGDADVVFAIDWGATEDRGFRIVEAVARIRPGYGVAQAQAELDAFIGTLADVHPEHRGWGVEAVALADDLVRPFRGVLAVLLMAGFVFLIVAVVNVVGLVAARRVEGRADRAIRLALGASEARLLRASVVEGVVLAVLAAGLGGLGARWGAALVRSLAPAELPRLTEVAPGPGLLAGTLLLGAGLGAVMGGFGHLVGRGGTLAAPASAWRAVGVGGRGALVVAQVALTTLFTAAAAAVLGHASSVRDADLGYEIEGLWTASTVMAEESPAEQWRVWSALIERLGELGYPAAVATNAPLSAQDVFPRVGVRPDAASDEVLAEAHPVSPGYFTVMGVELLAGRLFGPKDAASAEPAAIVSRDFVERYLGPGTRLDAMVGRTLPPIIYESMGRTVVGVVEDTRHRGPDLPVVPDLYVPLPQLALAVGSLIVAGVGDDVPGVVSAVIDEVRPGLRSSRPVPYGGYAAWLGPLRVQVGVVVWLGALALVLAALGLHSLLAYQVASAHRELGIRRALGAREIGLLVRVVGRGLGLAGLGAAIGLAAWYRVLPWAEGLVAGLGAAGGSVPLAVLLVVGGSCLLATLMPAVRATRADPVVALRVE